MPKTLKTAFGGNQLITDQTIDEGHFFHLPIQCVQLQQHLLGQLGAFDLVVGGVGTFHRHRIQQGILGQVAP